MAAENLVVLSAYREVAGLAWTVTAATFLMGVLWLSVGIRIPSKMPAAA
jgi:hypothetical protein